MKTITDQNIYIGISSCLLGNKVRYDGNHKEQRLITEKLSTIFEFVPVCPEMAIGLGVPRKPIRLTGDETSQRAVEVNNRDIDVTNQLVLYGKRKATELDYISGFIFKKGSPSCGLSSVKIYKSENQVLHKGTGLFTQQIIQNNPLLPVEDEGRLNDVKLRRNFLQRVEVYHRWNQLLKSGLSRGRIIDFHSRHKFLLLAHCEKTYRELGQLISQVASHDIDLFAGHYIALLMEGLKKPETRNKHINVLQHIAGFFKGSLDKEDKHEFGQLIDSYRNGVMPREALIAMLKHYLRKFPNHYLHEQYYLSRSYSGI